MIASLPDFARSLQGCHLYTTYQLSEQVASFLSGFRERYRPRSGMAGPCGGYARQRTGCYNLLV